MALDRRLEGRARNVSGVDRRGHGPRARGPHAGAYYFRVANRAVVGELIRAIEAGGGDIERDLRERDAVRLAGARRARAATAAGAGFGN